MAAHPRHPHLPAARSPGPQSRRRKSNSRFGIWACGIISVGALAAGAVFLSGAVEGEDPTAGGIACLIVGVFFAGLSLLISRLGNRAHRVAHFEVSTADGEYRRGEEVRARLRITDPAKAAEKVELGLVCMEIYDHEVSTGKGGTQRQTSEAVGWQAWRPVDPSSPIQEMTFTIPESAPFSYEGDAVSYAWRVSAREDRRARRDPHTDLPIWVAP
jgi:hypothetical protein